MTGVAVGAKAAAGGASTTFDPPPEPDFSPRKIRIVLACLLGAGFATTLLPLTALGVSQGAMLGELGWPAADVRLAISALLWIGALSVWALGWLTDRFGGRPVILVGAFATGLITLAISRVDERWQLYALFALLGVVGGSAASYPKVLVSLFGPSRGKALGMFGAAGALTPAAVIAMTRLLLQHAGWRGVFTASGAVVLLTSFILLLALPRETTASRTRGPEGRTPAATAQGMSFGRAFGDPVFWLLLVAGLVSMALGDTMIASVTPALAQRGFSLPTIAHAQWIASFFGIPGVLIVGVLMDRVQSPKIAAPVHLIAAVSAALLMIVAPATGGMPLLIAANALCGAAFLAMLPVSYYLLTRFFGLKSCALIYGVQSAIQAIFMGVAPRVFGRIHDVSHSYAPGFQIQIAASLFAAAVFLVLPAYRFSADLAPIPARPKRARRGSAPASAAHIPAE